MVSLHRDQLSAGYPRWSHNHLTWKTIPADPKVSLNRDLARRIDEKVSFFRDLGRQHIARHTQPVQER